MSGVRRVGIGLVLAIGLVLPVEQAQAQAQETEQAATVTLVTGDRISIAPLPAGRWTVNVRPAPRQGRMVAFQIRRVGGEVHVLPSDVAHLVPDVLDPALFDVTGLIRMGFGDRDSTDLPLLVQQRPGIAPAASALGPLRVIRQLRSIRALAVRLPKSDADLLGGVLTSTALPLSGLHRIWLDQRVQAARLDRNLRQIGAPAAWEAGLSGTGVRVAVLDTGVDRGHPDLAGRVTTEENFTDTPDATDRNGHGTHVASIVGGSGAASAGARRGVAFKAALLSGKVLDDDGQGQFSWIIAGMEWAAAQGARVVNMSLGTGLPSTGKDALSLAVNEISAASGVLFVVAAGNIGPGAMTITSPGAADAALTVGAVDGADHVAAFSGRGPRLGDQAIKPDVGAPGVRVNGARPGGAYTRLSGTSMATPHVAGAAALLSELRPTWTAPRLKSALMGTATPTGDSVFDRGAGRLDIAAAIRQPIVPATPQLSFGMLTYPQAELPAQHRTFTLDNTGTAPLTVDLAGTLRAEGGGPAPAGMLTVSPARLTVPAGGSASAEVALAPAMGGFGAFSGEIVATPVAHSPAVRIPVGAVKEGIHHLVHLRGLNRNGESTVEGLVTLINLEDITKSPDAPIFMSEGQATARLKPGFYAITSAIFTSDGNGDPDLTNGVSSVAIVTRPELKVDHEMGLVLDARSGVPISAAVRDVPTRPTDLHLFVAVQDDRRNGFVLGYDASPDDVEQGRLFVEPTEPVRHGTLEISSKWRLESTSSTYDLLFAAPGIPADPRYVVDADQLARVTTTYRAPTVPVGYLDARFVFTDVNPVSVAVYQPVPGAAPLSRAEYVTPGSRLQWFHCVSLVTQEQRIGDFCEPRRGYAAGQVTENAWLRAPLRTSVGVFRLAKGLLIGMNDLGEDADTAGSIGSFAFERRTFALYRDGVLVSEGEDPLGVHRIPEGRATFRLDRSVRLREGMLPLSTQVDSSWIFESAPPRRKQPSVTPDVVDARVHVPLGPNNTASADRPLPLELEVTARRLRSAALEVSTDDGRSWQLLRLRRLDKGRFAAVLPAGSLAPGSLVSLRAGALDASGSSFRQTIQRAFLIV